MTFLNNNGQFMLHPKRLPSPCQFGSLEEAVILWFCERCMLWCEHNRTKQ